MRETLHNDDALEVNLTIEEDEVARLVVESHRPDEVDLSVSDDVIVVVDGRPVSVESESPTRAVAELGDADQLFDEPFQIMLRVYEFFEGWEFGQLEE